MDVLFEIIAQALGEILLQVVVELFAELGLRSLRKVPRGQGHAALNTIGFALGGALAGAGSLLIMPHSALADPLLRKLNLLATPLLIGAIMALVGKARANRGQGLVALDRFGYAFLFAFCMNLVRFVWAA